MQARTGVVLTSQTILKVDFWRISQLDSAEEQERSALPTPTLTRQEKRLEGAQMHHTFVIEGATHFRRIESTRIYGVAQPTVDGLRKVLRSLLTDRPQNQKILWINLREEPIIYINGIPYVLRDRYFTLRNIRVYKGITGSRLEQLEERLKEDVLREVVNYDGRILLHGEDAHGNVQSAWEEVDVEDVHTVREVMDMVAQEVYNELEGEENVTMEEPDFMRYYRVPITAEKPPEWNDFDELRQLMASADLYKTAMIV